MKTVLCFGDSLTWGSRPDGGGRHGFEDRWPNVLRAGLQSVEVVADGLRGRTTAMDQHASPGNMNGAALLPSVIHSNAPLDLVILFLGTNDVYWGYPLQRAVRGIEHLIEQVQHHPMRSLPEVTPKVLVVIPPRLVRCEATDVTDALVATSQAFAQRVAALCDRLDVTCFDAQDVAETSPIDGIHLDGANTRAIGTGLTRIVQKLLV
ncbi:SGNH/GDSL hydrolase family protein [Litoreibacter sp.]|nr:SGNH/GDSL hydrolase family protein [Litoreibacter sp.]